METVTGEGNRIYRGQEEISTIFTGTRSRWKQAADQRGVVPYIRHCVFTHQIDFSDRTTATGRSYFQVLMAHGLDHWGRYFDEYTERDGRWLFGRRQVTTDGHASAG
jgi:SnoaL-like domain